MMRADRNERVFVAGHRGMVGSAIVRRLTALGYTEIITAARSELDLLDQRAVMAFFESNDIDQVYLAAARVGGIEANRSFPADFIYQNLMIEANVIKSAHDSGVDRLLFLGSSCIYPRDAAQPMREEYLLGGELEPTNEPYAIAKIAGIKLCESFNRQYGRDYRSAMPTNLYGPGDNFDLRMSHVIPALIRKFHDAGASGASEVAVWGSGRPRREFLHVDDLAAASVHLQELSTESYWSVADERVSHINVGTGVDCTIRELAESIAEISGFGGQITFDPTMPDGTPRKLVDVSRLGALGWQSSIDLDDGLRSTYEWFLEHQAGFRGQRSDAGSGATHDSAVHDGAIHASALHDSREAAAR
ncbi:MAG: GDP-L-fucose synthase [Mycetocola sp.]